MCVICTISKFDIKKQGSKAGIYSDQIDYLVLNAIWEMTGKAMDKFTSAEKAILGFMFQRLN